LPEMEFIFQKKEWKFVLLILNLQSADLSNLKICLSRSVQKNYGKSNQNQSEVSPQMYPYQSGFMFPIPPNNISNMQPPGLTFGPSQICISMLKHNMILGDITRDNYFNNQLWYTHLLYQIWSMCIYSKYWICSMKVDIFNLSSKSYPWLTRVVLLFIQN
jgi:hypothetical protein